MSQLAAQVTITDAAGLQQKFRAIRVALNCGCGCIDIQPGKAAFCRDFVSGMLTVDDGDTITMVNLTHGMASLTGNAVNVICERATLDNKDRGDVPIASSGAFSEGIPTLTPATN